MAQFVLNLLIALLWTLFVDADHFEITTFLRGYLVGLIILLVLHQFFGGKFYLHKLWVILKLILLFNYELITSSLTTSHYILFASNEVNPGIVTYTTRLTIDWQVTLLTMLILLTPGSVVLRISEDNKVLTIHALNSSEHETKKLLTSISSFERLIWEVVYA